MPSPAPNLEPQKRETAGLRNDPAPRLTSLKAQGLGSVSATEKQPHCDRARSAADPCPAGSLRPRAGVPTATLPSPGRAALTTSHPGQPLSTRH